MELVKQGVPLLAKAVDALAPMLPFPGGEAAALVSAVLGMAERAIANHDNLKELRGRAVAFLDILDSYHGVLVQVCKYHEVVGEYKEHLQGIVVYGRKYCSRNCVLKLFGGAKDEAHFHKLCDGLQDLTKRTMVLLQTDTLGRVQNVEVLMGEALGYLRAEAKYQDNSAELQALVEEAGGSVQALVASPGLMDEAMGRLHINDRLTIQMVTSLLAAQTERGPHRHIRQPDLQVLWREHFAGEAEVPWFMFFEVFPRGLPDTAGESECDDDFDDSEDEKSKKGPIKGGSSGGVDGVGKPQLVRTEGGSSGSGHQLAELRRLLRSNASRKALQRAVDRDGNDKVSAYELCVAFSGEQDLVEQVRRLLAQQAATGDDDADEEDEDADVGSDEDGLHDLHGRCMLPPPDSSHVGREEEAAEIAAQMAQPGGSNLVLLADGGMGKSSVAAAAGRILYGGGKLKGGVLWVDLRGANRGAEVEARFCAALGMQREEEEDNNVRRIARVLGRASAATGDKQDGQCRMLLVVDNAEDAVGQEEAAGVLRALLKELVGPGMLALRVLVTSRVPLGLEKELPHYKERRVGPISSSAAARIVRAAAQDLTEEAAKRVAAACGGVPLYLRLVSEALVAGRLRVEDIAALTRQRSSASSLSSSRVGGCVRQRTRDSACSIQSNASDVCYCRSIASGRDASEGGADGGSSAVDPLPLVLRSLKPAHRSALAQLAAFPAGFDDEAAAAVLQATPEEARTLLVVLYDSSLLLHGGSVGTDYVLHKAVRQALLASGAGAAGEAEAKTQARYGLYVLRRLGQWANMYGSNEYGLALAMARDHQPDIGHVAQLLAAPPVMTRTGLVGAATTALHSAINANLASDPDLATALSYKVCALLEALGVLSSFEPAWRALQQGAEEAGDEVQQAVMLSLLARVSFVRGRYAEGRQRAQAAVDLLRADPPEVRAEKEGQNGEREEREKYEEQQQAEHSDDAAAAALNSLALCHKAQGGAAAAERLLRRALSLRRRVLGEENPDTVGVMLNLASCVKAAGRVEEALPLYRKVLELRVATLTDKHPDTGAAYNSLANTLDGLRAGHEDDADGSEACDHYSTAVGILRDTLGREHPHTLAASANLARCYKRKGDLSDCLAWARWTLEAQERVLGPEHPETVSVMIMLASCYMEQDEYDEAEPLYSRVLAAWRGSGESEDGGEGRGEGGAGGGVVREEEVLCCKSDLARCLVKAGRDADAEPLLREVLQARRATLGPEHTDALEAQAALASCLMRQGQRLDEAQGLLTAVLKLQRLLLGSSAPATLATEHRVAVCVMQRGDVAAAETGLRRVLKARMRVLGTEHRGTLATMRELARCLMLQERFAEAQPILGLATAMEKAGRRRGGDDEEDEDGHADGKGEGDGSQRPVSMMAN